MSYLMEFAQRLQPTPSIQQSKARVPLVNRILISLGVMLASALVCWRVLDKFDLAGADFYWAVRAAGDLLTGRDPYNYPFHSYAIPYPLPAAFVGLPFVPFSPEVGAGLFFGISSGLLAFGITRYGYQRLLIFLSYPYFAALTMAQWSPLLMAGAFLPILLPAILVKPHIGLPIGLNYLTRRGFWLSLGVGILSLIIMPTWPWRWLNQVGNFQNFIPLLLFPGPVLLLALLNHRDRDARLLLLATILPQRWFYDNFILWLIPKSRRELLATAVISWGVGIWRWFVMPEVIEQVGRMAVWFFYLPMLGVLLLRWRPVGGWRLEKLLASKRTEEKT